MNEKKLFQPHRYVRLLIITLQNYKLNLKYAKFIAIFYYFLTLLLLYT